MPIFTAAELEEQIAAYKDGLKALASFQTVEIAGDKYTRAQIPEIRKTLEWLQSQKDALDAPSGLGVTVGRPAR